MSWKGIMSENEWKGDEYGERERWQSRMDQHDRGKDDESDMSRQRQCVRDKT